MALTEQQKKELDIAQTRINQNMGTDADKANIAYATANFGYTPLSTTTSTSTTGEGTAPVYGDVSGTNTFIPTPIPDQETVTSEVLDSDQYKEQVGFLTEEERLERENLGAQKEKTQQTYERTREDTLRAFQDALDAINRQAREVGIGVRSGSARRQLYDASGELSGIGQGVAARAIEPITENTRKLAERQGVALSRLTEDEAAQLSAIDRQIAALPLQTAKQKAAIRDQLVQGIFDAAKERQEQELKVFEANRTLQNQIRDDQREADKLNPNSEIGRNQIRLEQQAKGRFYINTPEQRDQLLAQGFDLFQIGNDVFALSAKEQADLDKKRQDMLTKPGTPSGLDKLYTQTFTDESGNRIQSFVNPYTGEQTQFVLGNVGTDADKPPTIDEQKLTAGYDLVANGIENGDVDLDEWLASEDDPRLKQAILLGVENGTIGPPPRKFTDIFRSFNPFYNPANR